MRNVHFSDQEIVQIIDTVVAVLNMGNVEFGVIDDDTPRPSADSKDSITAAARLLGVDLAKMVEALTMKKQVIGKETIMSAMTIDQAYQARDSLCKHLYGAIFSWIVQKINASISIADSQQEESKKPAKKSAKQ